MANPNPESQAGSSAAAQLEADVKRAVEQGLNLQDQVRQLTLAQISSGKFDLAALRELSQAVLNGALAGAQPLLQPALAQTGQAKEQLQQVVAGLDAALAGSLAQLVSALLHWRAALAQLRTPAEWGVQARALLAAIKAAVDAAVARIAAAIADSSSPRGATNTSLPGSGAVPFSRSVARCCCGPR